MASPHPSPQFSPQLSARSSLGSNIKPIDISGARASVGSNTSDGSLSVPGDGHSRKTSGVDRGYNRRPSRGLEHGIVITIPEAASVEAVEGSKEKAYVIYTILVCGPEDFKHSCVKRFNEFREFDKSWQAVYPGLHDTYRLPTAKVYKNIMKSKTDLTAERSVGIENYLTGLSSVAALQPLLATFLQLPQDIFYDPEKKKAGPTAPTSMSNIIDSSQRTSRMLGGMGVKKGNTDKAALRANAEKEAFLKANAKLIEALMPGSNVALPKKDASAFQKVAKKVGLKDSTREKADDLDAVWAGNNPARVHVEYIPDPGEEGCLRILAGEIIKILEETNAEWWYGQLKSGTEGYFPSQCVKKIEAAKVWRKGKLNDQGQLSGTIRQAYTPDSDEKGVLKVEEGMSVQVIELTSEDWWLARLEDGTEGFVPPQCITLFLDEDGQQRKTSEWKEVGTGSNIPTLKRDLADVVKDMSSGDIFTKFAYSNKGFPTEKKLFYRPMADSDSDVGMMFWCDVDKILSAPGSMKSFIALKDITEILLGKQTEAFQRKVASRASLPRCFSLVLNDKKRKTLDLEAKNPFLREEWVSAIVEISKNSKTHPREIPVRFEVDLSSEEHDLTVPGMPMPKGIEKPSKLKWLKSKASAGADSLYKKVHKPA